jgi:hypothetical protein
MFSLHGARDFIWLYLNFVIILVSKTWVLIELHGIQLIWVQYVHWINEQKQKYSGGNFLRSSSICTLYTVQYMYSEFLVPTIEIQT